MPPRHESTGLDRAIDRFLGSPQRGSEPAPVRDSDASPAFDLARLPVSWSGNQPAGQRFKSPTFIVTLGTQSYRSIDWSFGGLRCDGFFGVAQVGTETKVTIQDPRYKFGAVVRVFWISRSANQFVLQFTALLPETVAHLKQLAEVDLKNR